MVDAVISYDEVVPIDGYGPGFFRVAGQVLDGAALILPTSAAPWGGYSDTAGILAAASDIDVLLVGTGAEIAHLPLEFRTMLEDAGLGVEPMATLTACRLYNDLVSEGRRMGCALLPV